LSPVDLCFHFVLTCSLQSQEKSPPQTLWTIDDIVNQERAADFNISPDGQMVVWVKMCLIKEKDSRVSHLFLSLTAQQKDNQPVQLTRGHNSESRPRFSPSGQLIAFLSGRKEDSQDEADRAASGQQLWLLDVRGGEPVKVTDLEFGLINYAWLDDHHLLILAREGRTLKEIKEKEKRTIQSFLKIRNI